jgi:hypothetical protein
MGKKRRYTFLEIVGALYFILTLLVLAIKFGLLLSKELSEKIFNVYYSYVLPTVFVISLIISLICIVKSKKIRNRDDSTDEAKSAIATINISVISLESLATFFELSLGKEISFGWSQVTIYFCIIAIIIDFLVYEFTRSRLLVNFSTYNQSSIVNKYILYAIIISFIFAIIIPNLIIHYGVIATIRG